MKFLSARFKFKCKYIINSLIIRYRWRKRFKKTIKFESKLSLNEKKEYIKKWSTITYSKINLSTVSQVKGLTGIFNVDIVPEEVFALDIETSLNSSIEIPFFENKSVSEKWFGEGFFPKSYLHNIDGVFYDNGFSPVDISQSDISNLIVFPCIAKPNRDTYGGYGVKKLFSLEDLYDYIDSFKLNFVIQEFIESCDFFKKISGNRPISLRVSTYRSVVNENISVLNTTLRVGCNDTLDNASDGGIYLNINSKGMFSDHALNITYDKFHSHVNSGFVFENKVLPNYLNLVDTCRYLASKIPFTRILSFDLTLDHLHNWRVFEVNIIGQTIRFSQNFGNPFFGVFTDEVISYIKKYHKLK